MGGTGTTTPQPAHLVEDQDAQGGQLATDEQLQDKRPPITQFASEIPEAAANDVTTEADGGDLTAAVDEAIAIPQLVQIQFTAISGDLVVDDVDDGPLAAEEAAKAKDAATSTQGDQT